MKIKKDLLEQFSNGLEVGMGLVDTSLTDLARDFKRNVAGRYKLIKEGDLRHIAGDNLIASVKLDGQLHFLYVDDDECFLFNPRGRVVMGLPLLEGARELLGGGRHILAGELYSTASARSRVYAVTAALGSDGGDRVKDLVFAAFAILEKNSEPFRPGSFEEGVNALADLLPESGPIHRVGHRQVDSKGLSDLLNTEVVEGGQEGLICLSDDTHMIYKVKQRHEVDAAVIGFTERPDDPGAVRVLLTALVRPDGSFQVLSKVGGGIDDDMRRELFRVLSPQAVESEYKETDRNHTLFTMVRPTLVAEVGFHDVIMETASGKPQMQALLEYDDEGGYRVCVPERFVSIIFPTFRRLRDDKDVNADDLRLTQLSDFVDLDNLQTAARQMDLAQSSILRRDVYTKETKGVTTVRKFVSWQTNKDEMDDAFPPFVFCYVDFSPTRKDPLKRVIRVAPDREKIDAVHEGFLANEVKRGWQPVEP